MFRWTVGYEEIREAMEHVIGAKLSLHHDGQALPTEFVDDTDYTDRRDFFSWRAKKSS